MLDHRVVAFAASLPLSMKIRHGQGKWLLRQVLYLYVPRDLIERPKMGLACRSIPGCGGRCASGRKICSTRGVSATKATSTRRQSGHCGRRTLPARATGSISSGMSCNSRPGWNTGAAGFLQGVRPSTRWGVPQNIVRVLRATRLQNSPDESIRVLHVVTRRSSAALRKHTPFRRGADRFPGYDVDLVSESIAVPKGYARSGRSIRRSLHRSRDVATSTRSRTQ